jgi:hypothetical protein
MKLFFFLLMMAQAVFAYDVPMMTRGGGSIQYTTPDLLGRRGTFTPPDMIYGFEEMNRVLFSELDTQNQELKRVKYYLMNGEIRLASVFLHKLSYTQTKLRPIIYRYLAILAFIQGDFHKTYTFLQLRDLQNTPHYGKICVLKVLTEIVLDKRREIADHWDRCQTENPNNFRQRNLIWLETLVQLKIHPKKGITQVPFKDFRIAALDNEEAKVMMKLALYLNQESLITEQIPELQVQQLQDPEIRELAGQALFRTGALAKSYKYISDLKSPNSENIKGNLYLLRKKFEIAYAQFKLALEQKQNSQNAMERLLPLAWLLGDWEGGSKYSEQVIATPETIFNKMTLMAAFFMQKGDYEKSNQVLNAIAQQSRRGAHLEVTQLASFTALMQNKPDVSRKNAQMSCEQYDLMNCWVAFQFGQWDAFPLTIRREDKIEEKKEWEKLVSDEIKQPIKETAFVNQLDIEELDDKLIQLVPTP